MILTANIDTEARQATPGANLGTLSKMGVRGSGSSNRRNVYLYPGKAPFPEGATILSATLRVFLAADSTGSNSLTAKRVTTKWSETRLTYNNQPTATATNSAAASTTGDKGDVVEFDVQDMLQDVAAGGAFFGFQVTMSQDHVLLLVSAESHNPDLMPQLELEWTENPETPDRLAPDGDEAVSVSKPILSWEFADRLAINAQQSARIQLSQTLGDLPAGSDGTPDFDTGKIALPDQQYDTAAGAFGGVTNGDTWYWRVMVWNTEDLDSEWSEVATFNRTNLGTLTLDSPGSTVEETTPPIEWSVGGPTQARYRVRLLTVAADGTTKQIWEAHETSAVVDSVTPDSGLIKTGPTYRAVVEVWDSIDRAGDDHLTATQDFTYVRSGDPDVPDTATIAGYADADGHTTPAVQVDFTRASAPDYFCLTVDTGDGHIEVLDRIELADTHVSGDAYRIIYWGLTPRVEVEVGVQAVVLDSGVYKHSDTLVAGVVTPRPMAVWLVDDSTPGKDSTDSVAIFGKESADLTIGETATTFDLIGAQSPVRITDVIRGYEGGISGSLLGQAARDLFYDLKGRRVPLRLIVGDLSFPVRLEEAHAVPTPDPGDEEFIVSFTCFQVGAPWPVATP